jgi:hypothetical protein
MPDWLPFTVHAPAEDDVNTHGQTNAYFLTMHNICLGRGLESANVISWNRRRLPYQARNTTASPGANGDYWDCSILAAGQKDTFT